MTKMNRREYLIGMGAAAGVLASAKLDLFAHNRLEMLSPIASLTQQDVYVRSGPHQYDLLPTESVKLVFHGLMGIAVESANSCKVGFHSKPSGSHKHRLKVEAFTNCAPSPALPRPRPIPTGAKPVLDVVDPDLTISGVKFYQPPPPFPHHDNDFRHVIDLEHHKWYGRRLDWKDDAYKPIMRVPNGLFYTLLRTTSTFKQQHAGANPTSAGIHIGSVAAYVGVNIYLKPGGRVRLRIPEASVDLDLKQADGKHEIHFNNDCSTRVLSRECKFVAHAPDEVERNDFYMHRDAIDLGTGVKYQLVREPGPSGDATPNICPLLHSTHTRLRPQTRTVTDEAPCAALGYGYGGWPAFP